MTTTCITWTAIGAVAAGLGAIATAWMACQTHKSNKNAKEAILENKKGAFFDMVVSMYSNSRKTIEQMSLINEDCTLPQKPFGLECLDYLYEKRFKTELTITRDSSLPLSEQKDIYIIPARSAVEEKYTHIIYERYPNIGTYLTSVVAITRMVDEEKTIDNDFKDKCVAYMKTMMTTHEKLWLYYFSMLGYDTRGLLNRYKFFDNIPSTKLIVMQ